MWRFSSLLLSLTLLHSCGGERIPKTENPSTPADTAVENREISRSEELHSSFIFDRKSFSFLLQNLPETAETDPERFLELTLKMLDLDPWRLCLVDKSHSLSEDFIPEEIIALTDYPDIETGRDNLVLDQLAAKALLELSNAARKDGVTLLVSSTYRSWEYQKNLFARYADRDGAELASRYSARPGQSQHQLGTTVDFGDITNRFATSDAGLWMAEHGGSFGWSLSYPRYAEEQTGYRWESWHWRYVGIDAAAMQEEFFDSSQQAMFEFWNANTEILKEARK